MSPGHPQPFRGNGGRLMAAKASPPPCGRPEKADPDPIQLRRQALMIELDNEQQAARDWFESLRDRICAEFEAIEAEAGGGAKFDYVPWERADIDGSPGGGGVRGLMKGQVFEKVGVNVSTVGGRFSTEF